MRKSLFDKTIGLIGEPLVVYQSRLLDFGGITSNFLAPITMDRVFSSRFFRRAADIPHVNVFRDEPKRDLWHRTDNHQR